MSIFHGTVSEPLTVHGRLRSTVGPSAALHLRMMVILILALIMGALFVLAKPDANFRTPQAEAAARVPVVEPAGVVPAQIEAVAEISDFPLAPFFTAEVMHWAPDILKWSAEYKLDPNIIATIMQVESCGDPQAQSGAGAMGLFQVMPFHFTAGEDGFDPQTNSHRGLSYFLGRMEQTGGDVGLSFAGYNGGHVAAGSSWDYWAAETQRYYVWTTGILQDANAGQHESETLNRWLQAGGASLCRQAGQRLGLQY